MKTTLLLALATAVGLPLASAQDERRPENPPRSSDAERPPGPRLDGDRPAQRGERRPDGDRGPVPAVAPRSRIQTHRIPKAADPKVSVA